VKSTTYTLTPTLSLKGEGVYGWTLSKQFNLIKKEV
jgi:hypothetical protein